MLLLLAFVALAAAAPIETDSTEDLVVAEGRRHYSRQDYSSAYSAPGPLYAPSSHSYAAPSAGYSGGRSHVTSYNRRGHGSGHPKSDYGLRFSGPASSHRHESRDYAQPAAVYALPPSYGHEDNAYGPPPPSRGGYGAYGPPNHISAQSQLYSQDPSYDPAKDPVSQYAAYVPVREYVPKKHSDNRELSIYGYK